jgi:uncharacterized protein YxeA
MKKKQKIIVVIASAVILVIASAAYLANHQNDRCTPNDREQNNCVPAGRCTPPGDSRESTIDCQIKSYDRKFNLNK